MVRVRNTISVRALGIGLGFDARGGVAFSSWSFFVRDNFWR